MKIAICRTGGWRLTPVCIKTFYAKKGVDCFCYKRKNAGDVSEKYNIDNQYSKFLYYYSKDLGDNVSWNKIITCECKLNEWLDHWRTDPDFISTLQELGENAYSHETKIDILDIPDDCEYEYESIDGTSLSYSGEQIYIKQYL